MASATADTLRRALAEYSAPSSDYDLNAGVTLPEGRVLRAAAVLVLVIDGPTGPEVVLTKRSAKLKHHPGQIAFPGGKRDDGDRDLWATALREGQEEVALDPGTVEPLGSLPPHETVTGFQVTPHLAWASERQIFRPEAGEVDEIFFVPLSHVARPENFIVEGRRWQGVTRRYYAVPYGPYYIWGATARILRGLADRIGA